jgi:hypothetical protein
MVFRKGVRDGGKDNVDCEGGRRLLFRERHEGRSQRVCVFVKSEEGSSHRAHTDSLFDATNQLVPQGPLPPHRQAVHYALSSRSDKREVDERDLVCVLHSVFSLIYGNNPVLRRSTLVIPGSHMATTLPFWTKS